MFVFAGQVSNGPFCQSIVCACRPTHTYSPGWTYTRWRQQVLLNPYHMVQSKAMTIHHNVAHLGRRDHPCPREQCSNCRTDRQASGGWASYLASHSQIRMDINSITGILFVTHANEQLMISGARPCPHPDLGGLVTVSISERQEQSTITQVTLHFKYVCIKIVPHS